MALTTHWKAVPESKTPVMEEYYGTSGNLKKALAALEKIVNRINSVSEVDLFTLDVNSMPEVKILEDSFTKEFGFAKTLIHFDNASVPNAYTVAGGIFVDQYPGLKHMGKDTTVKYYDSEHRYSCNIAVIMCLIHNNHLTAKETMGIILHEIGHNFDNTVCTFVSRILSTILSFGLAEFTTFMAHNFYISGIKAIQDAFPRLSAAFNLLASHMQHLSLIHMYVVIPLNPFSYIDILFGSVGEYHSDAFAAKYGYGPDLASALAKLGNKSDNAGYVRRAMYSIPAIAALYDILEGPYLFIGNILDVHPLTENRILSVKKNLEKDYNDPRVPKKFKPEIKKQIILIDKIIEADKMNSQTNGMIFSTFRKVILYSKNTTPEMKKIVERSEN